MHILKQKTFNAESVFRLFTKLKKKGYKEWSPSEWGHHYYKGRRRFDIDFRSGKVFYYISSLTIS